MINWPESKRNQRGIKPRPVRPVRPRFGRRSLRVRAGGGSTAAHPSVWNRFQPPGSRRLRRSGYETLHKQFKRREGGKEEGKEEAAAWATWNNPFGGNIKQAGLEGSEEAALSNCQ